MADRPVALPYRFGLPVHGNCIGGFVGTRPHPQPTGSITRLVRGQQAARWQEDITSPLYLPGIALDIDNGNTWLDYAYLSGSDLDIGGQRLGSDKFLYNDGNRTWLLQWAIDPSGYFPAGTPMRKLSISVVALFGEFGVPNRATPALQIYDADFTQTGEDVNHGPSAIPYYTATQNEDGTKLLIQCHYKYTESNTSAIDDFLATYPWTARQNIGGTDYYTFYIPDYWHTVAVSGVGSTDNATLGSGITATLIGKTYHEYYGANGIELFKTLAYDGTIDMLAYDYTYAFSDGYTILRRTSDNAELLKFTNDYPADSPNVGCKFFDGGMLDCYPIGAGNPIRVHCHQLAVAPDSTGKTYDIGNDQWFADGCVV